jgi:Arylsulfotransferase (ASST)
MGVGQAHVGQGWTDEDTLASTTTRRQFLALTAGAAGLGLAGFVGHEWPRPDDKSAGASPTTTPPTPTTQYNANEARFFYSRPDLQPPRITVVRRPSSPSVTGEGQDLVLLSPKAYVPPGAGQAGFMVVQADGKLRWFMPTDKAPFDLQYQQFNGKPVLTWWEGTVTTGTGAGEAVIADLNFKELARIGEVDGLWPDLHELVLTDQGTALMTAYHPVAADLSSVGGPKKGFLLGAVAMEVDVATKKLLHRWDSVDHVTVDESYQQLPKGQGTEKTPFDYFHINSITVSPDGELLISGRNTWALYKVGRASGDIIWRLNGKKSDFEMGPGSRFYWQHHARYDGAARISLFDDGASPAEEPQSRAIILSVDESTRKVSLDKAFVHPARLLVPNQGSVQVLEDGGVLVGWGAQPYFSRFSAGGELVLDARFPTNIESYRAFSANFTAQPTERPAVAIENDPVGGGKIVYVSWNGSTQVEAWQVLGGPAGRLTPLALADWADFETAISVNSTGPHFQVIALDRAGNKLGSSEVLAA